VLKTVAPTDTVLAAMELMIDNNFRHVPVVRAPCSALIVMWTLHCLRRISVTRLSTACLQVDDGDYLGMVSIRDAVSLSSLAISQQSQIQRAIISLRNTSLHVWGTLPCTRRALTTSCGADCSQCCAGADDGCGAQGRGKTCRDAFKLDIALGLESSSKHASKADRSISCIWIG
jgi:CBS domain